MSKTRVFGLYFPTLFFALALAELCVIVGSVVLATLIRFDGNVAELLNTLGPLYYRALFIGLILLISLGALGLYQTPSYEGATGQELRACLAFLLGWVLLALLYYMLPDLYVGRGISGMACVFALGGIAVLRNGFFRLVNMNGLKPIVLVYGAGRKARWVQERLSKNTVRRGIRLMGFVDTGERMEVGRGARILHVDGSLYEYARRNRVDEIVIAADDRRNTLPMNDLLQCRLGGVSVIDVPTFLERETGSVDLELTDPSWLVFGQGFKYGLTITLAKRIIDVALAVLLLIVSAPLVLLVAIAVKLEDGPRAPLVYSQMRVGEGGRPFRLYKIRSMRVDAERAGGACWARKHDARITKVGRIIRKLRIDETPQLFNVLRGDMSFVGPRPERPEFTSQFEKKIRYYHERAAVKPGITGWAQLRYPYGASDEDTQEKLRYDLFYVKNHNAIFDILILLLTVEVVLLGKGAR